MAFFCLALATGLAAGLLWQSAQSRITPYVVEVDKLGGVQAVAPAVQTYEPTDAQIAHHLARFVQAVRSLSIDRSDEHTSELQSLMRISFAVFCLKKKDEQTQRE